MPPTDLTAREDCQHAESLPSPEGSFDGDSRSPLVTRAATTGQGRQPISKKGIDGRGAGSRGRAFHLTGFSILISI
jgi:hypothetical protein